MKSPCPVNPLFVFNLDSEAAQKKMILKKLDLDIGRALEA
jgi:hypothetical protein